MSQSNKDVILRPKDFSKNASLLNFGSSDDKIYVWADYIGCLVKDGIIYSHIHGIKYYYVKAESLDTIYYENLSLREKSKSFDFANCNIMNYPGDATIYLTNKDDSIVLFHVLESERFKRVNGGYEFKRMPSISLNKYNEYVADDDIEFNLQELKDGKYILKLNGAYDKEYKICDTCFGTHGIVSFFNRQDGRVYFVKQRCYLEPIKNNR